MFTKLLKHEFRNTSRSLGLFSIAVLLVGVFGFIMSLIINSNEDIPNNETFNILLMPIVTLAVLSFAAYIFSSAIILYKQFYTSKFTDEGYLTFTLPVTTHQILLSSILNVVIWSIITLVVLATSIILMAAPSIAAEISNIPSISPIFKFDFDILEFMKSISSILYALILPFLSITLGALWAKKKKLGAAFCIGYGINMIVSYITNVLQILEHTIDSPYAIIYPIIQILVLLLNGIGGYFLMHYLIDKKLNL